MEVDANLVRRIARLARIKVSDAEAQALQGELSGILDWVAQLDEVKTDGVEPMAHALDIHNVFADDVQHAHLPRAEALANSPKNDGECYRVPAVLGD